MKRGLSILMCTLLFLGVCAGCAGEKKVSGAADASVPEQKEDTVPGRQSRLAGWNIGGFESVRRGEIRTGRLYCAGLGRRWHRAQ